MKRKDSARRAGFDELACAEAFLKVVQASGFTRAARALGKSTSTLSRMVAELERQLGAQLLTRTTRRLHLTEAGTLYAGHAQGLLAARQAAHDAVEELAGGTPRGHLRVTMPVAIGERVLAPHTPELLRRYPDLRLELDLSDRVVPLLQGGYDLAIRVGRLADSSLRAQLLGTVAMRLVASPRYLAARGAPRQPEDIAKHACVVLGPLAGTQEWSFQRRGRVRRVAVDGVVHTTSPTLAAQLATAGVGLLRVVEWLIVDELRRGALVEVMPEWRCADPTLGGMPVYVVYAQTASVTPPLKSRVFVDMVKELIARDTTGALRGVQRRPSAGAPRG
jgi:DNA-binding transcriptional LysR family regulator